ncbi:MAG: hypothetical protein CWE10_19270, partial [Symbiobacterium thermophilum]|nr:hypothetical protein [Symbiobacterium thermophilum]
SEAAHRPGEAAHLPSEAAHRPGEAAHLPSEAAHRPGEAAHPPAKAAHPPAEGAHPPAEAAPAGQKGPALTLAIYPAPELAPLAAALGLDGEPLAPDGDHAADATTRELAWLPLLPGWSTYRTFPGSRLLAVAGYRRAALVAFEAAGRPAPMGRPPESHWQAQMWAPLGCDALAAALAPTERGPLFMEAPARLRDAIRTGRVRRALLGGADLTWALEQPGARAVRPLTGPGLDWMPVWGLFSRGVRLNLPDPPPELDAHLVLAPAEAAPGLTGWLEGAVVT